MSFFIQYIPYSCPGPRPTKTTPVHQGPVSAQSMKILSLSHPQRLCLTQAMTMWANYPSSNLPRACWMHTGDSLTLWDLFQSPGSNALTTTGPGWVINVKFSESNSKSSKQLLVAEIKSCKLCIYKVTHKIGTAAIMNEASHYLC